MRNGAIPQTPASPAGKGETAGKAAIDPGPRPVAHRRDRCATGSRSLTAGTSFAVRFVARILRDGRLVGLGVDNEAGNALSRARSETRLRRRCGVLAEARP